MQRMIVISSHHLNYYNQVLMQQFRLKKRQCQFINRSYLLFAFEKSNNDISLNYEKSTSFIRDQGIQYMEKLYQDYIKTLLSPTTHCYTFQASPTFKLGNPQQPFEKKELVFKQRQQQLFPEYEGLGYFNQHTHNSNHTSMKKNYTQPKSINKVAKLDKNVGFATKSNLKKITCYKISSGSDQNEPENMNDINLMDFQDIKNKTVQEMIEQSNRKMKLSSQKALNNAFYDSDASYEMTDYSSNESSNDNNYNEELRSEDGPGSTLFGNKFINKNGSSQANSSNSFLQQDNSSCSLQSFGGNKWAGFKPMKLTNSPKKDKKNNKRLFIRDKKIPKWAEDMENVKQIVIQQRNDPKMNPFHIYGACIVQNLDTNVIFGSHEEYKRGSSAKWSKYCNFAG